MSGNGLGIFDIVTTRGGKLAGTEYATGLFRSEGDATPFAMNITNDLGHLSFLHRLPLSDAGGIVSLDGGTEEFGILASRSVVRGELVGQVPEASQLIFLLIGAAGIVAAVFRIQKARSPESGIPSDRKIVIIGTCSAHQTSMA